MWGWVCPEHLSPTAQQARGACCPSQKLGVALNPQEPSHSPCRDLQTKTALRSAPQTSAWAQRFHPHLAWIRLLTRLPAPLTFRKSASSKLKACHSGWQRPARGASGVSHSATGRHCFRSLAIRGVRICQFACSLKCICNPGPVLWCLCNYSQTCREL